MQFNDMIDTVICGDNLEVMSQIPDNSIDVVITSPPYWGFRVYGEDTCKVWGGNPDCEHEWGNEIEHNIKLQAGNPEFQRPWREMASGKSKSYFCPKCGAWYGQLGLEPHPQMYINHLVEIFHELKRVLKPTGSFYLTLGDTYFGSWGNYGNRPEGTGKSYEQRNKNTEYLERKGIGIDVRPPTSFKRNNRWLQPKQLMLIPSRVAIALQEDGWVLRNDIIWHKPNPMPSSVKDRLNNTYEHLFHFVKARKYYYDLDAIRKSYDKPMNRWGGEVLKANGNSSWDNGTGQNTYRTRNMRPNTLGKNPGDVFDIPTQPFSGAHFAVFPLDLIDTPLKATLPKDGIVLDPFGGRGTVGRWCKKNWGYYIIIDISQKYCGMAYLYINGQKHKINAQQNKTLGNVVVTPPAYASNHPDSHRSGKPGVEVA